MSSAAELQKEMRLPNDAERNTNQRTSGPVNAYLTPGPGIFLMLLYMYLAPGQGQTSLGDKILMTTEAFSLCLYVASFKMISSKSNFIHIFNDFQGILLTTNPLVHDQSFLSRTN